MDAAGCIDRILDYLLVQDAMAAYGARLSEQCINPRMDCSLHANERKVSRWHSHQARTTSATRVN